MFRRRAALALCAAAALVAAATARQTQISIRAQTVASGFTNPVAVVHDPTDRTVMFVVEQRGRIRPVRSGITLTPDFLDLQTQVLSGGERGLLGLAFAPDYATSGRFYVNFTNQQGNTVVARFRRSTANPLIADATTRFDLRWNGATQPAIIAQPFANHNGGHLAFGPDGHLYVGMGDGGSSNDPDHRAQDRDELLGKMLRINVNVPDTHAIGYTVPADNPFVAGGARPEIWSFGLRNPWRYSFDDVQRGGTGALIMGDVGQNRWEEIDYEPRGRGGRNYGWRNREGAHENVTSRPPAFPPLIDPIHEYDHGLGASITGGYIYRGTSLGAAFRGRYFYADFTSSRLWSLALTIDATGEATAIDVREHTTELGGATLLSGPSSFGVDADGELYVCSFARGVILKIAGAPPPPTGLRIIR